MDRGRAFPALHSNVITIKWPWGSFRINISAYCTVAAPSQAQHAHYPAADHVIRFPPLHACALLSSPSPHQKNLTGGAGVQQITSTPPKHPSSLSQRMRAAQAQSMTHHAPADSHLTGRSMPASGISMGSTPAVQAASELAEQPAAGPDATGLDSPVGVQRRTSAPVRAPPQLCNECMQCAADGCSSVQQAQQPSQLDSVSGTCCKLLAATILSLP